MQALNYGIKRFLKFTKIYTRILDEVDFSVYDCPSVLPPLSQTKSRIVFYVVNNDVEGLKSSINYPTFFQVADKDGYPILQIAIFMNNIAVFDFLLSLDGCPIDARNRHGNRALDVALLDAGHAYYGWKDEHYAYSLLKKGADFRYDGRLLSFALRKNYCKVARFLIENGADLNYLDDSGKAPIHLTYRLRNLDGANLNGRYYNDNYDSDDDCYPPIIRLTDELSNADEIFAMLLCFGADPWMADDDDRTPLDHAFLNKNLSKSIQEQMVYYVFDEYCTDYEISLDGLFGLLQLEIPLSPYPLKCITSVKMDDNPFRSVEEYFINLFIIKPENLKLLLEKFEYVIQDIIDKALEDGFSDYGFVDYEYPFSKEMFVENFDIMLQSRFGSDVIEIINNSLLCNLFHNLFPHGPYVRNHSELIVAVLVMLSYGTGMNTHILKEIYKTYGDCEFFRTLLYMDIQTENYENEENQQCDIMPVLLYDIHMDIETFLKDHQNYSIDSVSELLNYFAHPKLQEFCYSLPMENEDIHAKVKNLPTVPLLVELARNQVRKFLIEKYKIKNSMQFYTIIKHLPICEAHQKIITLEIKLY